MHDLDPLGLLRYTAVRTHRCDFCGDPLGAAWDRWPCRDSTRTMHGPRGEVRVALLGFWAACLACSPYVGSRRWRRLIVERALPGIERHSGALGPGGREVMHRELAAVYLQFEQLSAAEPIRVRVAA